MHTLMFLGIFLLTATGVLAAAAPAPASTTSAPTLYSREITLSQIYRHGREMYRAARYPEAVDAFKQMIRMDCGNLLAHYHLQRIARQDHRLSHLTDYLSGLSCGTYNFEDKDFLPASIFYEKDTALLQEQLALYAERMRQAQATPARCSEPSPTPVVSPSTPAATIRKISPATKPVAEKASLDERLDSIQQRLRAIEASVDHNTDELNALNNSTTPRN